MFSIHLGGDLSRLEDLNLSLVSSDQIDEQFSVIPVLQQTRSLRCPVVKGANYKDDNRDEFDKYISQPVQLPDPVFADWRTMEQQAHGMPHLPRDLEVLPVKEDFEMYKGCRVNCNRAFIWKSQSLQLVPRRTSTSPSL